MTNVNIDASLYEVLLFSSIATPTAASKLADTRKPFRAGGATGVMELDLPKWTVPDVPVNGIDHWLPKGTTEKATVKVTVKGVAPLIQAYNAANGGSSTSEVLTAANAFNPAYPAAGTGFFDPDPSFLPHLSLMALLEGDTNNLYPLHTPWNADLPAGQILPGGTGATDNLIPLTWNEVEAHADDVWTPYDTDGKLYWDAYYYAFSNNDPALKFDRWKIQSGLDNSIDTLDGSAGNTGGAVYVKIGGGGGAMLDAGGKLVIGVQKPTPKKWKVIPATAAGSTFTGNVNKIVYGGGKFVAGGAKVTASLSGDGTAWTAAGAASGTAFVSPIYTLAYDGSGRFVAGSNNGVLGYSPDGQTWTGIATSANGGIAANPVNTVAYGNGKFVAGATTGKVAYSTDGGATWNPIVVTSGTPFGTAAGNQVRALLYAGGKWVGGGDTGRLGVSTDGINWKGAANVGGFTTANAVNSIAYGALRYVAVGVGGNIVYSSDGDTWTQAATKPTGSNTYTKVIYAHGKFITVWSAGIAWSYDGNTWTTATGTLAAYTVAYGADYYVAGAAGGALYTSPDGKVWTQVPTVNITDAGGTLVTLSTQINDIVYADGKWVIVLNSGQIAYCIPD
jgi:hypothetical protein